MQSTFAQALAERHRPPVILDAGPATELERRGQDVSGALWSAGSCAMRRTTSGPLRGVLRSGGQGRDVGEYQAAYAGFAAMG